MKKIFLSLAVFISLGLVIAYGAKKIYLQPIKFMSLKKVCKRWGELPLVVEEFRTSGENRAVRAKMACSLLKNQEKYIGMESQKVREIFGPQSGYFFSESFPTYLINKATKKDRNVWQILFFVDGERKVSKIVVHKNCCY